MFFFFFFESGFRFFQLNSFRFFLYFLFLFLLCPIIVLHTLCSVRIASCQWPINLLLLFTAGQPHLDRLQNSSLHPPLSRALIISSIAALFLHHILLRFQSFKGEGTSWPTFVAIRSTRFAPNRIEKLSLTLVPPLPDCFALHRA